MIVRSSPGSPSQWYATLSPPPASTWRSRQLYETLSRPADEPLHPRRRPLDDRVPALEPGQPLGLFGPEGVRVRGGPLVDRRIVTSARSARNASGGSKTRSSESRAAMFCWASDMCARTPSSASGASIVRRSPAVRTLPRSVPGPVRPGCLHPCLAGTTIHGTRPPSGGLEGYPGGRPGGEGGPPHGRQVRGLLREVPREA